jgi:uncharacterized lipoprotein YddW (UPF0748 family)
MKRTSIILILALATAVTVWLFRQARAEEGGWLTFLPVITLAEPEPEPLVEMRALWVTRFDWTVWNGNTAATQARIDKIVADAAGAGFNVLYFQMRAAADAYYPSDLEPWARRASGAHGQPPNPYWDPLAYLIEKANAAGLQVHAYLNVYPVAINLDLPPETVTPTPMYYQLRPDGLQWIGETAVLSDGYWWATPASDFYDDHVIAVALDIADRYAIDGLHLDRIRYIGAAASCDPVSAAQSGVACFTSAPVGYASYGDWQRAWVDNIVRRFYEEVIAAHPDLWLSAAVWPVHTKKPEWGWTEPYQQGYYNYFQDSKGWLAAGTMDSISPMIYPSSVNCPDDNIYWTQARWQMLVADFQMESNGRYIIPGIGTAYCDFAEIEARIEMAREIGAAGHALFSYSALESNQYFDDLAAGPYAETAVVPPLPWR